MVDIINNVWSNLPDNIKPIFVLTKNENDNVVCYNFDHNNGLNPKWVMFEIDGYPTENLNLIENKFCYGVKTIKSTINNSIFSYGNKSITSPTNNEWTLQIVSVNRNIYVKCHDGKWTAKTKINNILTDLHGLYVHITSYAGIIPTVKYVDIVGKDNTTERFMVK